MYCDFLSAPFEKGLAAEYMNAIRDECVLRKDAAGELDTIYVGGGTPTTLRPGELKALFAAIGDGFAISPDSEVTIEANPGTIDKEKALMLLESGVNRFSIGIQSFNDNELRLLDRIHDSCTGTWVVEMLRGCGVKNLSIDLMYGIPGQTLGDWANSISRALELSPEHISAYELTPETGTPFYKAIAENTLSKPGEDAIIQMYYYAIDELAGAGYKHYEISNFARQGFECRHNLNYWDRGQYIGIGAGAHSFEGSRRTSNTDDIKNYINSLKTRSSTVKEGIEISREDALRESIFLGMRKTEGLNIGYFEKYLGKDIKSAVSEFISAGLLESSGQRLNLTRKGIVVSNQVIAGLMTRLCL